MAETRKADRLTSKTLLTLTYFEWLRNLRSFRFLVSTGLLAIFVGLAVWLGFADYEMREGALETRVAREQQRLANLRVYSGMDPRLFKRPNPLAIFERGVTGSEGTEVEVSIYRVPWRATEQHQGNPYLSRLVGLDVTTVVKLVLGLCGILLTFDAMVGGRSRRRAEILRVHGASYEEVLLSKILGVAGVLAVSLVLSLGLPTLAVFWWGDLPLGLGDVLRLAMLFLIYGAYGLTMALLGLTISLRSSSVARSLVSATMAWLVLVILLPMSLTSAVTAYADLRFDPMAVEQEIKATNQRMMKELGALYREDPIRTDLAHGAIRSVTNGGSVLRRLGSAEFNDSLAAYYEGEVRLAMRYAVYKHGLRQKARAEEARLTRPLVWLAVISPGRLLDVTAARLAGTSSADHERFLAAARDFRLNMVAFLEEKEALGSWRWFTDDPPEGLPWTSFVGFQPQEVAEDQVDGLVDEFSKPEIQDQVTALLDSRHCPEHCVDLSEMPSIEVDTGDGWNGRLVSVLASVIMISILWVLAWEAAYRMRSWDGSGAANSRESLRLAGRGRGLGIGGLWSRSIYWAELRSILWQLRWRAASVLVVMVMALGAAIFVARITVMKTDQRSVMADYGEKLEGARLSRLVPMDHPLLRPPSPLGFVLDADDRVQPSVYYSLLSTWGQPRIGRMDLDTRRLSSVPAPDWVFTLRVVLSLMAFFFAYDAFCGPQLKRCRIQMAGGVSLTRIAAAKGAALWTALAIPWLLGCAAAWLILKIYGAMTFSTDDLWKLVSVVIVGLWALVFYVATALVMSAWWGRAEKALVTLVLLWIGTVAVLPSSAGILVLRLERLDSDWALKARQAEVTAHYSKMEGYNGFRGAQWAEKDDYAWERRAAELHHRRWREQLALGRNHLAGQLAQAEHAELLASLSPTSLLRHGIECLLGSGVHRQRRFVDQARSFEEQLKEWFRSKDALDPNSGRLYFFSRYLSKQSVKADEVPRFEFQEAGFAECFDKAMPQLLLFFLWTLGLVALVPWILRQRVTSQGDGDRE